MTNYSRGADFERAVKKDLEKRGWVVVRAAGSHGVMDLVALFTPMRPMFVQCKTNGKISFTDRKELAAVCSLAGATPVVASRPKRGVILYRRYYAADDMWDEVRI